MSNISVIISVYNKTDLKLFNRAVSSIIQQTLKPLEIIIICDGCCIESFRTHINSVFQSINNIKIFGYEDNLGPGYARHYGINLCQGKYIAIMDSDDYSLPDRLQLQYSLLEKNKDISVCGGDIEEILIPSGKRRVRNVPRNHEDILRIVKKKSPINNVTAFFRKKDYLAVGGYPSLRSSEDYCLWVRFLISGKKLKNIDQVLVEVDFDELAITRRNGNVHFKNDKFTQSEMLNGGLISYPRYFFNLCRYGFFRFSPGFVKKILYQFILRK